MVQPLPRQPQEGWYLQYLKTLDTLYYGHYSVRSTKDTLDAMQSFVHYPGDWNAPGDDGAIRFLRAGNFSRSIAAIDTFGPENAYHIACRQIVASTPFLAHIEMMEDGWTGDLSVIVFVPDKDVKVDVTTKGRFALLTKGVSFDPLRSATPLRPNRPNHDDFGGVLIDVKDYLRASRDAYANEQDSLINALDAYFNRSFGACNDLYDGSL